jgi:hypothetical protein
MHFATKYFIHTRCVFDMSVILLHVTDGFISPSKESVPLIFIVRKNPASSAGFERANLGTSSKHFNH